MNSNSSKTIEIRVAAAFIVVLTSFAIYSLTPSASSQIDNKLNALFSQCTSSLLPKESFDHDACSKLYAIYSQVSKSGTYEYLSDEVMFELHRTIVNQSETFDIAKETQGFMQRLPSGKYHTTRRTDLLDVMLKTTSHKKLADNGSKINPHFDAEMASGE